MYATMGDQCLIKKRKKRKENLGQKTEVATFFTDVTDYDNEQKITSASSNSSYYQMCISKRQKSDIIINIIRQPKPVS